MGGKWPHDKVATFDGVVSTIGSSNLDQESTDANFEANVWSTDPAVAGQLDSQLFAADLQQSLPITQAHLGAPERIRSDITRLLAKKWL
jgi:phosphatidylserine/phosphatidylglycerophosphate/cardiolipin synthase-like enzyme